MKGTLNHPWQATAESESRLGPDELFHALQNERRRRVLRYLLDNEGQQFEMRDIAEHVAALEQDTTPAQITSDERKRVYIALYQCHLPKLAEFGLVEYDQQRGHVRPRPEIDQAAAFLDATMGDTGPPDAAVTEPWIAGTVSVGTGLVAAVGALLTLAVWLELLAAELALAVTLAFAVTLTALDLLARRRITGRSVP